jgi:hypothetical protein
MYAELKRKQGKMHQPYNIMELGSELRNNPGKKRLFLKSDKGN